MAIAGFLQYHGHLLACMIAENGADSWGIRSLCNCLRALEESVLIMSCSFKDILSDLLDD